MNQQHRNTAPTIEPRRSNSCSSNYNLVNYNQIERYKHKEFSLRVLGVASGKRYLGYYQKFYLDEEDYFRNKENINNNNDTIIIYEFLNPYTRQISRIPVYMLYQGLYVEKSENPPKMSEEMKNEIVYHPYHMFVNGDIVNFIPESTREYFNL